MIGSSNSESCMDFLSENSIPFDVDIDRYHKEPREEVFTGSCSPAKGVGDRAMDCPSYDMCLGVAVDQQWGSYNCEACTYSDRGELNFRSMDFIDLYVDDCDFQVEFVRFNENELLQQGVFSRASNFEDTMISLIDEGGSNAG